jgi:hypothetical protein
MTQVQPKVDENGAECDISARSERVQ